MLGDEESHLHLRCNAAAQNEISIREFSTDVGFSYETDVIHDDEQSRITFLISLIGIVVRVTVKEASLSSMHAYI